MGHFFHFRDMLLESSPLFFMLYSFIFRLQHYYTHAYLSNFNTLRLLLSNKNVTVEFKRFTCIKGNINDNIQAQIV